MATMNTEGIQIRCQCVKTKCKEHIKISLDTLKEIQGKKNYVISKKCKNFKKEHNNKVLKNTKNYIVIEVPKRI